MADKGIDHRDTRQPSGPPLLDYARADPQRRRIAKKVWYAVWLLLRQLVVAAIAVVGFPALIAAFYVIGSLYGGHANDETGNLFYVFPFAGIAFVIACLITFLMLFPAMLVCDAVRLFKGYRRRWTAVPGSVAIFLLYLPWELLGSKGLSTNSYLAGSAFFVCVFALYWSICQSIDFLAEKLLNTLKARKARADDRGESIRGTS